MAQPYFDQLTKMVAPLLKQNAELQCKHFFSGAALYCEGRICASLSPKGLAFKLDEVRAEQLIMQQKAIALRYFEKSPVKKGYILLPDYKNIQKPVIRKYLKECVSLATQNATLHVLRIGK